jgi:branched-chain amino acid transport system substrate-binding protein
MRAMQYVRLMAGVLLACLVTQVSAANTMRIAFIDPLSGTFANVGEMEVRSYQYAIDVVNARGGLLGGGIKLELATFDSRGNPQDALLALKQATDQGIRFVTQGSGSAVALALSDAITKHNSLQPDRTVLFLNYAAIDPVLTNDRCSFWHFRFDADADMRMSALTDTIAANKKANKVYLINQDYGFGRAVAKGARSMLEQKRPDVSIVGDDLHPLGKVKDFSPYVAKIKASGADSIITGNWGDDLVLLVKAAADSGLTVDYYTYFGTTPGMLTALGERALGHVKEVGTYNQNPPEERAVQYIAGYRAKYMDDAFEPRPGVVIEMLAQAIEQAGSTDPAKVALALETMTYDYLYGAVQMRADNHQLIQPLFIVSVARVDGREVKFDSDHSGMGWKADRRIEGRETIMPTTCKMERPQ